MGKSKQSNVREGLLIVFVTACFVLVALTLIIAFNDAGMIATTENAQGYPAHTYQQSTLTPSAVPLALPPTIDPRTKQPTLTF